MEPESSLPYTQNHAVEFYSKSNSRRSTIFSTTSSLLMYAALLQVSCHSNRIFIDSRFLQRLLHAVLLGYNAMHSSESQLTFWKKISSIRPCSPKRQAFSELHSIATQRTVFLFIRSNIHRRKNCDLNPGARILSEQSLFVLVCLTFFQLFICC
jgi:hypothetical protein